LHVAGAAVTIDEPGALMQDELWKERFGFVSGTILVWGLVLIRLWPSIAAFQTGRNVHFWTLNTPGEGVQPELWMFWILTALLALGGWTVALSILHVLSRGIWLMVSLEEERGGSPMPLKGPLDSFSSWTYAAVFTQWIGVSLVLAGFPLVLLSAGGEHFLSRFLSARTVGWIVRMTVAAAAVAVVMFLLSKGLPALGRLIRVQDVVALFVIWLVVLFGFFFAWMAAIELCGTVSLAIDAKVVHRDQGVTVAVALGGTSSDPRAASLQLTSGSGATIQTLQLYDTGGGTYLNYIPAVGLGPGLYRVVLSYPHASLVTSFPYVSRTTTRVQSYLVLP
jgi:hypothetical protein